MPIKGMDQLRMLQVATDLYYGKLPLTQYHLSYLYTIFLYILIIISKGDLFYMRLLQAAVCALVPVVIYKVSLRVKLGLLYSCIASLIYFFYGPAILLSLSFLRAVPLSLCFITFIYFIILSYQDRKLVYYLLAGLFAALCILGRENFIPVVLLPVFFLVYRNIRREINYKNLIWGVIITLTCIFSFVIFNGIKYDSFAIIPGNFQNVLQSYHGRILSQNYFFYLLNIFIDNAPSQIGKFISSYEIPNSVSFYAHRDIVNFLYVLFVPFNLLVALSVTSLIVIRKNTYIIMMFLLILCYLGTMIFFDMFYRFRIPVVPLMCIISAFTLKEIASNWNKIRVFSLFLILISLALFFLTYTEPNKKRPHGERLSAIKMLINQKRFNEAEIKLKEMNPKLESVRQTWIKYYKNRGY